MTGFRDSKTAVLPPIPSACARTFGPSRVVTLGATILAMIDRRERYADDARRRDAERAGRTDSVTPDIAIERASAALRLCGPSSDPTFPIALLRGNALLGHVPDATALLERWAPGFTGRPVRSAIDGRSTRCSPGELRRGSGRQQHGDRGGPVTSRRGSIRDRRSTEDIERLLTPLILAGQPRYVGGQRPGAKTPVASSRSAFLEEALPRSAGMRPRGSSRHAPGPTPGRSGRSPVDREPSPRSIHSHLPSPTRMRPRLGRPTAASLGHASHSTTSRLSRPAGSSRPASLALGVHPNLAGNLTAWVRSQPTRGQRLGRR